MKIKSFILAMVACAGLFTACSEEIDGVDNVDGNGNEVKADAYMSVAFTVPGSSVTRASGGEVGDGPEVGLPVENVVKTADIFLFQNNQLILSQKNIAVKMTSTGDAGTEYKSAAFGAPLGTYNVYVIVNPEGSEALSALEPGTTLNEFQSKVFNNALATANYCRNEQFLMTNAFACGRIVNGTTKEGEVTITLANNTEEKCASVIVSVERAAAKLSFTPKAAASGLDANEHEVANIGKIKITAYKVINTRNSAWFLKRTGDGIVGENPIIGGDETPNTGSATNYVIENFFYDKFNYKEDNFDETFYNTHYSRRFNTYVAWRTMPTTNDAILAYCMENTMHKDNQVKGLTTTILFKAKVTPTENKVVIGGKNNDGTFYRNNINGELYKDIITLLKARYSVDGNEAALDAAIREGYLKLNEVTWNTTVEETDEDYIVELKKIVGDDISNVNDAQKDTAKINTVKVRKSDTLSTYIGDLTQAYLHEAGIDQFQNGYCYYTYLVKHSGDKSAINGIMEFATVRNNVYIAKSN